MSTLAFATELRSGIGWHGAADYGTGDNRRSDNAVRGASRDHRSSSRTRTHGDDSD